MTLIAPYIGEAMMLNYIVNIPGYRDPTDQPVLHLYTNDLGSIAQTVSYASFTEPAGGTGYSRIPLSGVNWNVSLINGITTTAQCSQVAFNFISNVSVYGYFVTNSSASYPSMVLWAEEFSGAPFELPTSGGEIVVTPKLTLE